MERLAYLVLSRARTIPQSWRFIGALSLVVALTACGERDLSSGSLIETAKWDASTSTLQVMGHAKGDGTKITVANANDGRPIGSTLVTNQHYWRFKQQNLDIVPCKIKATTGSRQQTVDVENAPSTCNKAGARALPTNNTAIKVAATRTPLATLPDANITSPAAQNITIIPGTPVIFSAIATSPANVGPVSYLWNFDGGAPNSNIQNPGAIVFNVPGTYRISLQVSNSTGIDPTPATRVITVLTATPPGPTPAGTIPAPGSTALAPIANIDTPMGLQNIKAGDSIFFSGSGFDPNGNVNTTLTYLWDFGGGAANSTVQVPGLVTFSTGGQFIVTLVVTDSAGNRSLNNPSIVVIVGNQVSANQPPAGVILAPNADMTVPAGTALFFQGSGVDPDGNLPLTYAWDFGGVAPNSTQQNPGMIAFTNPGIFLITLTVTDSSGAADPNPPIRIISVTPGAGTANNDLPDGIITIPAADITVNIGDPIVFNGTGSTPNPANEPLTFHWDFGDPAVPEALISGPVVASYGAAGTYTVTFHVLDAIGQADPTPAQIIVTVLDPAAPPGGGTPGGAIPGGTVEGNIIAPPRRRGATFAVGQPIDFIGLGEGGTAPYSYLWNFGDPNIPDSMEQFPTGIVYSAPGDYIVTLIVTDAEGVTDPNPPQRMINVVDAGGAGAPPDTPPGSPAAGGTTPIGPDGMILSPAGDVTIAAGDSVDFAAEGMDPAGSPLTFVWDFGRLGGSTAQNPGSVTFDQPGIYEIELTVINDAGIPDATPATVTVTVIAP